MPRRLLTSGRILWTGLGVLVFYFVGYFFLGPDDPRILMTSLLIGACAALHVGLFGAAVESLRRGLADGGDNVLVSVWGVYSLLFYYFIWVQTATILRIRHEQHLSFGVDPEVLRNLPVSGAFITLFFIVASFTIFAPLNGKVEIARPSLHRWVWAIAFGGVVAGVIATLSFQRILNFV